VGTALREIVGRDVELEEIGRFLASGSDGTSTLVLEGAAGVGKTTLWDAGVRLATDAGHRVLRCRPVESEARLSYAALGDLLDLELPPLPGPQRRALDAALLRDGAAGPAPDQRAVSLALLGVLRGLATAGPVTVAIDDIQWLDASSERVLTFAARRLRDEPIHLLLAMRTGVEADPLELRRAAASIRWLPIRPLDEGPMIRLLRDRLGDRLAHPAMVRVHRVSSGNPFFALEIARALADRTIPAEPGRPVPLPDDLQQLLRARLAHLPADALEVLLTVAAATRPTMDLAMGASLDRERARDGIGAAERADVIRVSDERIEFSHPLLGSTVYMAASTHDRRRAHERLADLVADPEERARHLALATAGPDPDVAHALEAAARHASARGASDSAAELAELARKLTPPDDPGAALRRSVDTAVYRFDAGDAMGAVALLEGTIASEEPGPTRAAIIFQLAAISWLDQARVESLCQQALAEAEDEPRLSGSILEHLAWVGIYRGDLAYAAEHAEAAKRLADRIDDPSAEADVVATAGMVDFLGGLAADDTMREALTLQERALTEAEANSSTGYTPASACYGLQLLWAGRLDESRDLLERELDRFAERGRYLIRDEFLAYLAEVEVRAGNWETAARYAEEAYEIDLESGRIWGRGHTLFPKALVEAHLGDVEAARADAEEGLRLSEINGDALDTSCNGAVLGFLELSLSNPSGAIERLDPVLAFLEEMDAAEPGVIPCIPDAIEALVALGDLERAGRLLAVHEEKGRARHRPWALASTERCHGLLKAARSDRPGAMAAFERAIEHHAELDMPFELGRTLLVLGEAQRRFKQRRAAANSFRAALEIFGSLPAPLWVIKAKEGLARTGGRAEPGELTETERRVAELVADGLTNREVADALFLSVKTVEANLSRIFQKLGITSRRALRTREPKGSSDQT